MYDQKSISSKNKRGWFSNEHWNNERTHEHIYQLSNDFTCPPSLYHRNHSIFFGPLDVFSRMTLHCIRTALSSRHSTSFDNCRQIKQINTKCVWWLFSLFDLCVHVCVWLYVKPHTTNNFAIKINYCSLSCPLILFCCILHCIYQLGCIRCSNFEFRKSCWLKIIEIWILHVVFVSDNIFAGWKVLTEFPGIRETGNAC